PAIAHLVALDDPHGVAVGHVRFPAVRLDGHQPPGALEFGNFLLSRLVIRRIRREQRHGGDQESGEHDYLLRNGALRNADRLNKGVWTPTVSVRAILPRRAPPVDGRANLPSTRAA